jgi:hypothetical protein
MNLLGERRGEATMKLATICAGALAICCMTSVVAAQEIGGRYAVKGSNPGGGSGTYTGFATVRGTSGGQCEIKWQLRNTPASDGFCMRQGDVFVAAYRLGSKIGLVTYRLQDNGVLDGTWSIAGQEGIGKERLTPVR